MPHISNSFQVSDFTDPDVKEVWEEESGRMFEKHDPAAFIEAQETGIEEDN